MAKVISFLLLLAVGGAAIIWFTQTKDLPQTLDSPNKLHSSTTTWRKYVAPKGQFSVLLPSLPHHATDMVNEPITHEVRQYEMFLAKKDDGTVYSINLISFPAKKTIKEEEKDLEKLVNELLSSNPNNKVKNVLKSQFRENKAIDFSVEADQMSMSGKAFLKDSTLYVLSTSAAKTNNSNTQEFNFFINSFQLAPGAHTQTDALDAK